MTHEIELKALRSARLLVRPKKPSILRSVCLDDIRRDTETTGLEFRLVDDEEGSIRATAAARKTCVGAYAGCSRAQPTQQSLTV